jgi:cytochrome P450
MHLMRETIQVTSTVDMPHFPFARTAGELTRPPLHGPDGAPLPRVGRVMLPTGKTAWLVAGHDEVRQVLRSPDFSADVSRPGFPLMRPLGLTREAARPGFFIRMDPPDHTLYRRILTPEFMIKNMRRLEPLVRETVLGALASMRKAGPPADLVEHFALPVPSMVICHLLGVPYEDHEFFQDRSRTMVDRTSTGPQIVAASQELRTYLADLVARKQREGGHDDLIGRLVTERLATGQISVEAVVGMSVLLLIAGHETTANMIGLATLALLRHPDQTRRLREHPELMDDAVEELLRYLTVIRTGIPRLAVVDTEVGGQTILAGEGAIAMLAGANHDPSVFPDPDQLDLARGSHQHVAFGFGIHQCIGQPLARTELRIALAELLGAFPGLALAGEPSDVDVRDDAIIYGLHRLPVTW